MPTNIIIADDHPLFRVALKQTLSLNISDVLTYEASNIGELEQILLNTKNIDLLVLDLHMPSVNGFEGLAYITQNYAQLPIVMISADEEPSIAPLSKRYGAMGFIPKSANISQISEAISVVLEGGTWFPDIDEENLLLSENDNLIEKVSSLTSRQLEVFNLLTKGLLNKQIAFQMNVTEATVKAHLTSIMRKLEVNNRTEVILIANKINIKQFTN